jgi:TolA-binding protein
MDLIQIWEIGRDLLAGAAVLAAGTGGVWAYKKKAKTVAEGVVSDEWRELAEVRGQTIDDMIKKIGELEERIARLEGSYAALQGLKSVEIADEVVSRLQSRRLVEAG